MKEKFIFSEKLFAFLDRLTRDFEVYAPIKHLGMLEFLPLKDTEKTCFSYANTYRPPKDLFYPQTECLFYYQTYQDQMSAIEEPVLPVTPRVLFGVRPCDARSLLELDKVFQGEKFQDPYYIQRRENTLIVSLGCNHPNQTCFCTSVGGGPFDEAGSDLQLAEVENGYLVKAITQKGEQLLARYPEYFIELDQKTRDTHYKMVQQIEMGMPILFNIQAVIDHLEHMEVEHLWEALSEKCVGCSICAYLCPTCHCFDITDEVFGNQGARLRTWDSCAFPLFTLEASGFNPRPTQKERVRNRIMHKFAYFPETHALLGCVGCGRCVTDCPVNLDIREVLKAIAQLEEVELR